MIRRSSRDRSTCQLPQPLRLTTRLAAQLVRERSRHPRQIRNRRHPRPQPRTDVLHRRAPPQIIEAPPRPRRLSNHVQLPQRGAQTARSARRAATPRRPTAAAGPRASRPAPSSAAASRSEVARSATRDRCPPRSSPHPCRGSPSPTRQSTRSSRIAMQRRQQPARIEPVLLQHTRHEPQPPSLGRCAASNLARRSSSIRSSRRSGANIWISSIRSSGPASYGTNSNGISNPHARNSSHQRVQARRHHPLLIARDHRPILPAHPRQLLLTQPRPQPRLPQNRRAPHRVLTHGRTLAAGEALSGMYANLPLSLRWSTCTQPSSFLGSRSCDSRTMATGVQQTLLRGRHRNSRG